jgi:hypothetical protein
VRELAQVQAETSGASRAFLAPARTLPRVRNPRARLELDRLQLQFFRLGAASTARPRLVACAFERRVRFRCHPSGARGASSGASSIDGASVPGASSDFRRPATRGFWFAAKSDSRHQLRRGHRRGSGSRRPSLRLRLGLGSGRPA